jgi:phosphoribosyl 1,2-cyclic phosphate phosphodiesterase
MKITFLGTGTSHGVPEIGCTCSVCRSPNPRNQRLRSSVLIQSDQGPTVLIDASIDFRQQALRYGIDRLTDILITHTHADHILGLDETRIFCRGNVQPLRLYLSESSDQRIRSLFDYVYDDTIQKGGGVPKFENIILSPGRAFQLHGLDITPIELYHGKIPILGYRINNTAYLTDCSFIPPNSHKRLDGLELLILDALRIKPHSTHFCLEQAIQAARAIGAKRTLFIHMNHKLEHTQTNAILPAGMQLAYDGLIVEDLSP